MKKLFSFIIIFVLSICNLIGTAFADDFSVRNGVKFGMTLEDVKKIENDNGITYFSEESNTWLSFSGTSVAGVDNSEVIYRFNENGLFEITYNFDYSDSDTVFKNMTSSLKEKYGEPLHSFFTDGKLFPIHSYIIISNSLYDTFNGLWYEWLLENEKNSILIDLALYPDQKYYIFNHCGISYRLVTEDEINKYYEELGEKEQKIEDEKNRDL